VFLQTKISTCQNTAQLGRPRHANETPLSDLFLLGDNAGGRGIGSELACRSGIQGADTISNAPHNGFL